MSINNQTNPSMPHQLLLEEQAKWLAPARSRLFRRIGIAHRQMVLDLGAGYGSVTSELTRRSRGCIVPVDINYLSLREICDSSNRSIHPVNADSFFLPFPDNTFDLVFCQCSLMWMTPLESAVREIHRILLPGGVLIAVEPDYGGLIEHPPQIVTRDLWLPALEKAGADPLTGRKLVSIIVRFDMATRINLLDELQIPDRIRFEFLHGLPLTFNQKQSLNQIEQQAASIPLDSQIAHLPFFLISATKR